MEYQSFIVIKHPMIPHNI